MTEDELAEQFQKHRKVLVKFAAWRFSSMDEETIDMLYTDLWTPLKSSNFRLVNLKSYLETALANRIKNHIRDKIASKDLMDRGLWIEPNEDDESPSPYDPMYLPDLRPYETEYLEDVCNRVRRAIGLIPQTLAIVGEWYYVEELGVQEIAERLKCTHQNVSIMLARFRSLFGRKYHELCNLEV